MLSFISWGQFWTYIAIALAFYYLFIAVIYYGNEIQSLLKGRPGPARRPEPATIPGANAVPIHSRFAPYSAPEQNPLHFDALPSRESDSSGSHQEPGQNEGEQSEPPSQADEAAFFEEMEDIADRLKAMMERTGTRTSRAELMDKITKELRAFSSVVDISPFKQNLAEYIQVQSSELCDVELEDTDVDAIWNNLHP